MFKEAIKTIITSVSDANETFVKTYVTQPAVQEAALAVVEAQRTYATASASAVETYADAVTAATKKVFNV